MTVTIETPQTYDKLESALLQIIIRKIRNGDFTKDFIACQLDRLKEAESA